MSSPSTAFSRTPFLNGAGVLGFLGFMGAMGAFALLIPWLGPDPTALDVQLPTAPPGTAGHWLGTDDLGRDLMGRLAIGARISLLVGLTTAIMATALGAIYGMISGYCEGKVDTLMMRGVDVLYSLPGLMLVILFSVFLDPLITAWSPSIPILTLPGLARLVSVILALSFFSWPDTARIVRGEVLRIKREQYIEAYHSIGGRPLRLFLRHFLPNLTSMLILTTTMTVPRAILTESTLSFIGLGVQPPLSSWGTLASDGWQLVRVAPHLLILPALFIFTTMVVLNLLGDKLRTHLNPKTSD